MAASPPPDATISVVGVAAADDVGRLRALGGGEVEAVSTLGDVRDALTRARAELPERNAQRRRPATRVSLGVYRKIHEPRGPPWA